MKFMLQKVFQTCLILFSCFRTVVSNALWPEYEMINDDENEYDAEMSDDNIPTHSLVSRNKMDNTMNSLLDIFEVSIRALVNGNLCTYVNLLPAYFSAVGRAIVTKSAGRLSNSA